MFKQTMKSFFKSLRFVVVPMAFIYLGVLSLLSLVFEGLIKGISHFSNVVGQICKEASGTVSLNVNSFVNYAQSQSNITPETLTNFLNTFINDIKGVGEAQIGQLQSAAAYSTAMFIGYLIVGLVIFAISFLLGTLFTGFVIRRDSGIKISFWKWLVRALFKALLFASFLAVAYFAGKLTQWLYIAILFVYSLLDLFLSFLFAYFLHKGRTDKKFKEVIKARDFFTFYFTSVLITLIAVVLSILIILIGSNIFIAIILFAPFLVLMFKFYENNAETYVVRKMDKMNNHNPTVENPKKQPKTKKA